MPFSSFVDAYKAYEKHADVRRLIDSAVDYMIPESFDGELPEFAYGKATRLVIGEQYKFDDGKVGTLKQGLVIEANQELMMIVDVNGKQMLYKGRMSDEEITAYRRHPETFFGELSTASKQKEAKTPFDLFLFFYETYKKTPRENILEFLEGAPDIQKLSKLPTEDLRLLYSERVTLGALKQPKKD